MLARRCSGTRSARVRDSAELRREMEKGNMSSLGRTGSTGCSMRSHMNRVVVSTALVLGLLCCPFGRSTGWAQPFPVINWHHPVIQPRLRENNGAVGLRWSSAGAAAMFGHGNDRGIPFVANNQANPFQVSDNRMIAALTRLRPEQG